MVRTLLTSETFWVTIVFMQFTGLVSRIFIKKALHQDYQFKHLFVQAIPFFLFGIYYFGKIFIIKLLDRFKKNGRIVIDIETEGIVTISKIDAERILNGKN